MAEEKKNTVEQKKTELDTAKKLENDSKKEKLSEEELDAVSGGRHFAGCFRGW